MPGAERAPGETVRMPPQRGPSFSQCKPQSFLLCRLLEIKTHARLLDASVARKKEVAAPMACFVPRVGAHATAVASRLRRSCANACSNGNNSGNDFRVDVSDAGATGEAGLPGTSGPGSNGDRESRVAVLDRGSLSASFVAPSFAIDFDNRDGGRSNGRQGSSKLDQRLNRDLRLASRQRRAETLIPYPRGSRAPVDVYGVKPVMTMFDEQVACASGATEARDSES